MIYNESLPSQEYYVSDTVGNIVDPDSKVTINLGVDTIAPTVTPIAANQTSVTLQAADEMTSGSGLWNYDIRAVVVSSNDSIDINTYFDADCNLAIANASLPDIAPSYPQFPLTGSATLSKTVIGYDSADSTKDTIVYCVQDNAKNKTVGTYPFDPNSVKGCFSDGSEQFVPNLKWGDPQYYVGNLATRITDNNYGYGLTDTTSRDATNKDFRTKLAQNIETYIKQQYNPTTDNLSSLVIDIGEKITPVNLTLHYAAKNKGTETRNNNGYYYFE